MGLFDAALSVTKGNQKLIHWKINLGEIKIPRNSILKARREEICGKFATFYRDTKLPFIYSRMLFIKFTNRNYMCPSIRIKKVEILSKCRGRFYVNSFLNLN